MNQEKKALSPFLFVLASILLCQIVGCMAPSSHPYFSQVDQQGYDMESEVMTRKVLKPERPVVDFLRKRGWDLLDTFSFRLAAGPGIRAHVQVTQYLQVGAGYVGPAEGKTLGQTFPVYKLGYLKREGGLWEERTAELGISLFYYYQTEGKYLGGNKRHWGPEDRGLWDIGFAGHWLLVGAEAEIRPDEIIDFIGGFFGVDYMDDDGLPPDPDILRPVSN